MCFLLELYSKNYTYEMSCRPCVFCVISCRILIDLFVDVGCSRSDIVRIWAYFSDRILPQAVCLWSPKLHISRLCTCLTVPSRTILPCFSHDCQFCHRQPKITQCKGALRKKWKVCYGQIVVFILLPSAGP